MGIGMDMGIGIDMVMGMYILIGMLLPAPSPEAHLEFTTGSLHVGGSCGAPLTWVVQKYRVAAGM
jgi:hypothetical protein